MFAAYPDLEVWTDGAAALHTYLHELPNRRIERHKGIVVNDPFVGVFS